MNEHDTVRTIIAAHIRAKIEMYEGFKNDYSDVITEQMITEYNVRIDELSSLLNVVAFDE